MEIPFYKYQGTGNDFVIIDNRQSIFNSNDPKLIALLCDRKFGIGADGLILIEAHQTLDFKMLYFNADGQPGSMCGNGGRCVTHLAKLLGLITSETTFEAVDGVHTATIQEDVVSLKMNDVDNIVVSDDFVYMDTGSPHHVQVVDNLDDFQVVEEGAKLRYETYGTEGANINFVEVVSDRVFKVRTYERGVEDETLSCGTGVTAVAIAVHEIELTNSQEISLLTQGGKLTVGFTKTSAGYNNIYLEGTATLVFKGIWI